MEFRLTHGSIVAIKTRLVYEPRNPQMSNLLSCLKQSLNAINETLKLSETPGIKNAKSTQPFLLLFFFFQFFGINKLELIYVYTYLAHPSIAFWQHGMFKDVKSLEHQSRLRGREEAPRSTKARRDPIRCQ